MKKTLLALLLPIALSGCSSIGEYQLENFERADKAKEYSCATYDSLGLLNKPKTHGCINAVENNKAAEERRLAKAKAEEEAKKKREEQRKKREEERRKWLETDEGKAHTAALNKCIDMAKAISFEQGLTYHKLMSSSANNCKAIVLSGYNPRLLNINYNGQEYNWRLTSF